MNLPCVTGNSVVSLDVHSYHTRLRCFLLRLTPSTDSSSSSSNFTTFSLETTDLIRFRLKKLCAIETKSEQKTEWNGDYGDPISATVNCVKTHTYTEAMCSPRNTNYSILWICNKFVCVRLFMEMELWFRKRTWESWERCRRLKNRNSWSFLFFFPIFISMCLIYFIYWI